MNPIWIFQIAVGVAFVIVIVLTFVLDKIKFKNTVQLTGIIDSFKSDPSITNFTVNTSDPEGEKIKSFYMRVTTKSNYPHLKIRSYLRPNPIEVFRGDELDIKGELVIKVFPEDNDLYINLDGVATSVKKNGKEFLPSVIITARDWLLAFAAILVAFGALVSLLWNLIFNWSAS